MPASGRMTGDRALLRFLVRQGRITADDATRIEKLLEAPETTVHDVLERESIISQKELAALLATTLRLRIIDLTSYPLDANVTRELKETIATRYEVVPISIDDRSIEVVTANPLDLEGLKAVEFATGKRVQAVVATHLEVKDALAHTYRLQESLEQFLNLVPSGEQLVVNELDDDGGDLRSVAAEAELPPVIKLADKMLIEGIKSRASDIHLEPGTDSVLVRYRVDGILEEAFRFPKWIQNPLVARLKVMAKLDITERRLPQDGRIQVRYQDKTVDMRVSSLPAQHGEKITLRILDASQAVKALDRLGLSAGDLKVIRDAAKKPQGMILITGPTGSGKTTTLYALLREIFSPKTNIVTIENPIEYQLKGINQVEVNEKQGLTFGGVLRSVLRQDPDVILLGEIRDKETAQIAFQAASTGHLVLSTVHTNDAAGAVTRLLDLGLEPYAVASALNLVVAQRLVRQLCPTCSAPVAIDDETRRQLHLGPADSGNTKRAVGCAQCRHIGYRSRTGVYELLPMTSALVKLVEAGAGESMVRQQARSDGMHSLLEDAVEKLSAGLTTVEELQRVVQITDEGGTRCPGCQKQIAEDYSVCPHCSRVLHATCAGCTKPLNPEWVRCPFCGTAAPDAGRVGEGSGAPAERRSFKALVVDDTPTIRDVVQHALDHSDLGLTVLAAENGPMALELASRERPDIIILDISMPDMDGFEVCRRLRSDMRTAFVPVLMLTAHDSEEDVAKGFGVGADDYMVKPFRREGLLARVRRILERTYGAQAVAPDGATAAAAAPSPFAPAAAPIPATPPYGAAGREVPSVDVSAALAALASDRDVLRQAVESCELRLGELLADRAVNGRQDAAAADVLPAIAELRTLVGEMRAAQDRAVAELRSETARAVAVAEEALRTAGAAPASAPPAVDPTVIAMQAVVERLQDEQLRLVKMVAATADESPGIDEECERRLREATHEIAALRTSLGDLEAGWRREAQQLRADTQAAWQREVQELRDHARAEVERARRAAEERAAAAVERATSTDDKSTAAFTSLRHELTTLRDELDVQRGEVGRDGTRLRAAEERLDRLQTEALAAVDTSARQVAALQRAVAEHQEQRGLDVERIAVAEETMRRARGDLDAATAELREQLAAVRRTLGEHREGSVLLGGQLAALEATSRNAEQAAQAIASDVRGQLAAVDARALTAEQTVQAIARDLGGRLTAVADGLGGEIQALQRTCATHDAERARDAERLASADQVVLALHAEIDAAAARTDRQLAELRDGLVRESDAVADQARRVQGLEEARRQSQAAIGSIEGRVGQVRRLLVKIVRRARGEQRAVAAATEAARRAPMPAPGSDEAQARLAGQVAELAGVTERLGAEQRRLAADVEERQRALMRTAAGGFDVQLALLRGKVEVLARTLRERGAVDPTAPFADPMLEHRHGLLERLRQQLGALQSGTDWRPQRVLDLLIESTLSAAVTPFRKMLQLADGEPTAAGDQDPAAVTDESAGPSSDP